MEADLTAEAIYHFTDGMTVRTPVIVFVVATTISITRAN